MGLNLFCKSMVCQVLMQTFNGFYECTKQPADLGAGWCEKHRSICCFVLIASLGWYKRQSAYR